MALKDYSDNEAVRPNGNRTWYPHFTTISIHFLLNIFRAVFPRKRVGSFKGVKMCRVEFINRFHLVSALLEANDDEVEAFPSIRQPGREVRQRAVSHIEAAICPTRNKSMDSKRKTNEQKKKKKNGKVNTWSAASYVNKNKTNMKKRQKPTK